MLLKKELIYNRREITETSKFNRRDFTGCIKFKRCDDESKYGKCANCRFNTAFGDLECDRYGLEYKRKFRTITVYKLSLREFCTNVIGFEQHTFRYRLKSITVL
jgi:hypothetical protein